MTNNLNTFFFLHNTGFTFNEYGSYWSDNGCLGGKVEDGLESFRDDRKYLIYDLNGKEVLSGDISSYMDFANFKFEVKEQLRAGVYLFKMFFSDGHHSTEKIIIQ